MFLSIITPVYNRCEIIKKLYTSIKNQDRECLKLCEWVISDDGSTDDIEGVVNLFKQDDYINIEFVSKENGGKHTAVNRALDISIGKYIVIIDSDDFLVDGALPLLIFHLQCEAAKVNAFLDFKSDAPKFSKEIYNTNGFIGLGGDRIFVVDRSIIGSQRFPVNNGEKFVTESVLWNSLIDRHFVRCFNVGIVSGEYLEGGLSSSYNKLLRNNPKGVLNLIDVNLKLRGGGGTY